MNIDGLVPVEQISCLNGLGCAYQADVNASFQIYLFQNLPFKVLLSSSHVCSLVFLQTMCIMMHSGTLSCSMQDESLWSMQASSGSPAARLRALISHSLQH